MKTPIHLEQALQYATIGSRCSIRVRGLFLLVPLSSVACCLSGESMPEQGAQMHTLVTSTIAKQLARQLFHWPRTQSTGSGRLRSIGKQVSLRFGYKYNDANNYEG